MKRILSRAGRVLLPVIGILAGMNPLALQAQNTNPTTTQREIAIKDLLNTREIGNVLSFDSRYEGVRGTPNIYPDWSPGEIILRANLRVKDVQINYDAYNDQLIFLSPEGKAMQANSGSVDCFRIVEPASGDTLLFKKKLVKPAGSGRDAERFVQVIYEGDQVDLYQVYDKKFVEADYKAAYSPDRRYDEFVDDIYLVACRKGQDPEKLKPNRRNLLKLFKDRKTELEEYLDREDPDLDSLADLAALFSFIDRSAE